MQHIIRCIEPPLARSTERGVVLLNAVKSKLKELVETDDEFARLLKEEAGDRALDVIYYDS